MSDRGIEMIVQRNLFISAVLLLIVPPLRADDPAKPAKTEGIPAAETGDAEKLPTITNTLGMKLVEIPAGEFLMGSPPSNKYATPNESPQHRVQITKAFYMGQTEVTKGQWKALMGTEPWVEARTASDDKHEDEYPATYIRWEDAVEFCKKLSEKEGTKYRLPTEAEWEYACRAGTTTNWSFGDDESQLGDYAWWGANADGNCQDEKYAHEPATKKPNSFGLYDMHGNMLEWCSDWDGVYSKSLQRDPKGPKVGTQHVMRGGAWFDGIRLTRAAIRRRMEPGSGTGLTGFRVVRVK